MKKPKSVTITKNDLKKALSVPWSVSTCLLAQVARRVRQGDDNDCFLYDIRDASDKAAQAMNLFDKGHGREGDRKLLSKLAKMLPIKVKL